MKKNKYSLSLSLKFLCRVVLMTLLGTSFLCFSVKGDPVEPQRVTLNVKEVSLSVLFQEIKKQSNHPKPTVLYVPQYVANFVSKKSCSI